MKGEEKRNTKKRDEEENKIVILKQKSQAKLIERQIKHQPRVDLV